MNKHGSLPEKQTNQQMTVWLPLNNAFQQTNQQTDLRVLLNLHIDTAAPSFKPALFRPACPDNSLSLDCIILLNNRGEAVREIISLDSNVTAKRVLK